LFSKLKENGFEIIALHHAEAILTVDMPKAVAELEDAFLSIDIPMEELVRGGGGEGQMTQRLRRVLAESGWVKHNFDIKKIVDGEEKESTSHEVDHVKRFETGTFALEIEWNNKDPFFDRDLENFKRLHAEGAISIGAIVTRGSSLQAALREKIEAFAVHQGIVDLDGLRSFYRPTDRQAKNIERAADIAGSFAKGWASTFVADKFGEATTHWRKLEDRVRRGVGNPCPLLLLGIPAQVLRIA
jgi:hypothetical protein